MSLGRVVVLNGSSSAGKTSLATALQSELERRGQCWVLLGWDDFVPRIPARWHRGPGLAGDRAEEGVEYRVVGEDDDGGPIAILETGPVARRMLRAYHRSVAALVGEGIDVIVDEVLMTAEEWVDWHEALTGAEVRWVGVHCPPDVVAERERRRGDRWPGLARGTAAQVHRHATYDVEVDSCSRRPDDLAREIVSALRLVV